MAERTTKMEKFQNKLVEGRARACREPARLSTKRSN